MAIETICQQLEPSGNLNQKIAKLVKKGLDDRIIKSLDIVRITGNDKIHPGQINNDDDISVAIAMFELCNYIVDRMIIQPQKIDELFNKLPQEKKDAIEKRDLKKVDI